MISQLYNSNLDSKSIVNFDYSILAVQDIKTIELEVNNLDFSDINAKLISEYSWSQDKVEKVSLLYRKWIVLQKAYPELSIAPSESIDEYWHMHILDTRKYMIDCMTVFGYYLHHYPYFGLKGDSEDLDRGFEITRNLFKIHFNQELLDSANPCKSTSCR